MPDNINIPKIAAVLAAAAVSTGIASHFTESYAAQSAAREKTLAEAVMRNQLRAELDKAEKLAEKELAEQGQTLVTEILETKPPVTEPPVAETEPITETETETAAVTETTSVTADTTPSETEPAEEEIITEFTRGGLLPADRTGIPIRTMFGLSAEEQNRVIGFLTEHYFLDGYKYSREETRPALKEKKLLAAEMESGIIETMDLVMNSVNISDISAVLSADYGSLKRQVEDIRGDFVNQYSGASEYGEDFSALYDGGIKYLDRMIEALGNIEDTSRQYREAANPLLALGLLTSSLDGVIIPEIMAVLEQSFDLVEASQEIFLEGTVGTVLLTRGEVQDIITNPALALAVC